MAGGWAAPAEPGIVGILSLPSSDGYRLAAAAAAATAGFFRLCGFGGGGGLIGMSSGFSL